ncbi:hypothetical protein QQF64_014587 [Cirrhinus molitorella]|uniref:ribonuclease H n=1 Tax=Cirrhinus molitorella TaxID=172907 RepID=A0ABR3NTA4_9TELE
MVPKVDGGCRPCGNYRRLDVTTPDRYPVPHIQDFSARLAGKKLFLKVDLIRGYHQVPVYHKDIPKTAVITPFGLFDFLRMPFGLKNAAQTFQRMMDSILRGLDFLFIYLDDILIASVSMEEHLAHLQSLFVRLSQHGLIINPAKCQFGLTTIDFLGHRISSKGAVPLPSKVDAITGFPTPRTTKTLQEFLGMVNFYHRFFPRAAALMHPLYKALKGNKQITWSEEMTRSFDDAKLALAHATMLSHPIPDAPISITTDASDYAVGDDTFELHSVQVELEAVEKQIRQLLERQAELRAALESSRALCTQDALFPDVLHSGAGTPRTLGAAAAEDASQATDDDLSPSAAPGLRDLHPEPLRSPPRDGTRRCDRRRFHRQIPAILKDESVGAIVLHAGVNDIRLRQTEVLKRDFGSLIETVRSTAPETRIIVSGPLPTYRRGLFRADGLHPSRVGAELLSDNISRTLRSI